MKLKLALAAGFLAGAAAVVVTVVSLTGNGPLPTTPEANAAEPGKAAPGTGRLSQYESTKPRPVVEKLAGKYSGPAGAHWGKEGEYELQCYASRSRVGGGEVYRVGIGRQFRKIDGAQEMPEAEFREMVAGDATDTVEFIDRMKAAKKGGGGTVDYALARWDIDLYTWSGEPSTFDFTRLTTRYDGTVKFSPAAFGSLATLKEWCQDDPAHLAKVLTEGLKDVEALKKVEWSPVP